ncbi:MAG: endonuclease domain-containing protein [Phaeodactylibacter sp.]|nr:endonuclease domain-containing protein [Phaeodactylibacter sp.]
MDQKNKPAKMHHGASPEVFRNAEILRREMTEAEQVLWEALRNKRLAGFKFRRQHPISKYVLDFYCHQAKLAIELDGEYHEDRAQQFYDTDRTANLQELSIDVIRFQNEEVLENLDKVLVKIREEVINRIGSSPSGDAADSYGKGS